MSKPLTKGRTIGVRLTLGADAELRRRASLKGLSPAVWIAAQLERALDVSPAASKTHHPSAHGASNVRSLRRETVTPIPKGG